MAEPGSRLPAMRANLSRVTCGVLLGGEPPRPDLPVTGTHVQTRSRRRLGLWSNTRVFVRVWEYEVPGDRAAAFTTAYAADGAWGELFGRAAGFLGTELYRDAVRSDRFLTIDRWQNEEDWQSFLHAFGAAYESLDARLEGLAAAERSLFEGSS
jgi:heme-degrading monooxygenase HmoA